MLSEAAHTTTAHIWFDVFPRLRSNFRYKRGQLLRLLQWSGYKITFCTLLFNFFFSFAVVWPSNRHPLDCEKSDLVQLSRESLTAERPYTNRSGKWWSSQPFSQFATSAPKLLIGFVEGWGGRGVVQWPWWEQWASLHKLRDVFLRVFRFSPLLKNQRSLDSFRSGNVPN